MKTATKTLFATLAAASAIAAVGAPATAQPYGRDYGRYEQDHRDEGRYEQNRYANDRWNNDPQIDRRQARLERQIWNSAQQGFLTRQEVRRLDDELREISRLEARYSRNGLSAFERNDLHRRLSNLEVALRAERADRDLAYGYRR